MAPRMDDLQRRESRALRRIDRASIGAVAWVVVAAILGAMAVASRRPWDPAATLYFGRLVPPIVLAYFVSRRSRVAAVLLFGWIVASEGATLARTGSLLAALFLMLFGWATFSGVLGTVEWHRLQRERAGDGAPDR